MNSGILTASYLLAAVLFILSLAGLSKQETAKSGNLYGMIGMAIALVATLWRPEVTAVWLILIAMAIGAVIGAKVA
ncbi:hypothetical protein BTA51_28830, partial [Hahella sp. CCB-MM4]|uniref:NAD(P)(+) transhydrogenase (Re/Si-specific) subunit beta n=1 Tax=Hahella sp. (strain CCB-MM4) TaxID=1926491 RepID=UPI000BCB43E2